MNIERADIRLAGFIAAGIVAMTGITIAIIPATHSRPAPSNAAAIAVAQEWQGLTSEEQGYACNVWLGQRDSAQLVWAELGANVAAVTELSAIFDSYCTLEA